MGRHRGKGSKKTRISQKPEPLSATSTVDPNAQRQNPKDSRPKKETPPKQKITSAPPTRVGLLVTAELEQALNDCKAKVQQIAKECRASNRKFRDVEFDLGNMAEMCLYKLSPSGDDYGSLDARRVSEIFKSPKFFVGAPHSSDIEQGALGDCWFLSALSTTACSPGLIEKLCVARDEKVGVYGFIFFKDGHWVHIVIDDQLFYSTPKFDALSDDEQNLYHNDKALYEKLARKGGKGLTFANSKTTDETWVPLMEKAYAKLHGDYDSLSGGLTSEGIEDLTGGISVLLRSNDILDTERFWKEELLYANNPNLFSVSFDDFEKKSSAENVEGLMGNHAYAVLRAKECEGKRFVVVRNPWGDHEWDGAWSDKSKEWTTGEEGLKILKELNHVLGDDGEFVMEYTDFLNSWTLIERTTIFDANWIMSAHWLRIPSRPLAHGWTFGEVIFQFSMPKASKTFIMLSPLDGRYFLGLGNSMGYNIDFVVYNTETKEQVGQSYSGSQWHRSTSCELQLDQGTYEVYPRIDRAFYGEEGDVEELLENCNKRKLSRVLTQRTNSRSIASNFELGERAHFLPISPKDLSMREDLWKEYTDMLNGLSGITIDENAEEGDDDNSNDEEDADEEDGEDGGEDGEDGEGEGPKEDEVEKLAAALADNNEAATSTEISSITLDNEDEYPLFLGMRVYTKKDCVVEIMGMLC